MYRYVCLVIWTCETLQQFARPCIVDSTSWPIDAALRISKGITNPTAFIILCTVNLRWSSKCCYRLCLTFLHWRLCFSLIVCLVILHVFKLYLLRITDVTFELNIRLVRIRITATENVHNTVRRPFLISAIRRRSSPAVRTFVQQMRRVQGKVEGRASWAEITSGSQGAEEVCVAHAQLQQPRVSVQSNPGFQSGKHTVYIICNPLSDRSAIMYLPDVPLSLALSIWTLCHYRQNTETHRQTETQSQ